MGRGTGFDSPPEASPRPSQGPPSPAPGRHSTASSTGSGRSGRVRRRPGVDNSLDGDDQSAPQPPRGRPVVDSHPLGEFGERGPPRDLEEPAAIGRRERVAPSVGESTSRAGRRRSVGVPAPRHRDAVTGQRAGELGEPAVVREPDWGSRARSARVASRSSFGPGSPPSGAPAVRPADARGVLAGRCRRTVTGRRPTFRNSRPPTASHKQS